MDQKSKSHIEKYINSEIINAAPLAGGCSFPSFRLETQNGEYFVKTSPNPTMAFRQEATGLAQLRKYFPKTPEVIAFDESLLILPFISSGSETSHGWETFGVQLAEMHKVQIEDYGFFEDNSIGRASQKNSASALEKSDWAHFFWNNRLRFKIEKLNQSRGFTLSTTENDALYKICMDWLGSYSAHPSPCHGDLWSGNIHCDSQGEFWLIDPAFYFGDRESDLAMTECFGGFPQSFYDAYNRTYPFEKGYEERKHLYNLYHMLNHLLIFGGHYETTVRNIISMLMQQKS